MVAVIVNGKAPACVGVPEIVPVPVPAPPDTKFTPIGNVPVCEIVGVGPPVDVILNVPRVPTVNVVLLALLTTGGAIFTGVNDVGADAPLLIAAAFVAITVQV